MAEITLKLLKMDMFMSQDGHRYLRKKRKRLLIIYLSKNFNKINENINEYDKLTKNYACK